MLDDKMVVLSDERDWRDISKAYWILKKSWLSDDVLRLIQDFLWPVDFLLKFDLLKDEKLRKAYKCIIWMVINNQVGDFVKRVEKIIWNDNPSIINSNENTERFTKEFWN